MASLIAITLRFSCILLVSLSLTYRTNAWNTRQPTLSSPQSVTSADTQLPDVSTRSRVLKEATPVKLKLLHSLNSKTAVAGDPVNFAVAEDVLVSGEIVIKTGAAAIGRVLQAKPARTLGRSGQLALEIQYLKVGRVRVPLRGSQSRSGEGRKVEAIALAVLFGPSALIKHGSEIQVKEGSVFTAYVERDTELPSQPESGTRER